MHKYAIIVSDQNNIKFFIRLTEGNMSSTEEWCYVVSTKNNFCVPDDTYKQSFYYLLFQILICGPFCCNSLKIFCYQFMTFSNNRVDFTFICCKSITAAKILEHSISECRKVFRITYVWTFICNWIILLSQNGFRWMHCNKRRMGMWIRRDILLLAVHRKQKWVRIY